MTKLKLKQVDSTGANSGASLVFDGSAVKWSNNHTGAVLLPSGATSQRPTGANGHIRYNSETGKVEAFENGTWKNAIIDPATVMQRFSVRVNYAGTTAINSVTDLPSGWSLVSINNQTFTISNNTGKLPFGLTAIGWDPTAQKYQARPGNATFYFRYDPNNSSNVDFVGCSPTALGTTSSGHSYIWILY